VKLKLDPVEILPDFLNEERLQALQKALGKLQPTSKDGDIEGLDFNLQSPRNGDSINVAWAGGGILYSWGLTAASQSSLSPLDLSFLSTACTVRFCHAVFFMLPYAIMLRRTGCLGAPLRAVLRHGRVVGTFLFFFCLHCRARVQSKHAATC